MNWNLDDDVSGFLENKDKFIVDGKQFVTCFDSLLRMGCTTFGLAYALIYFRAFQRARMKFMICSLTSWSFRTSPLSLNQRSRNAGS